MRRSLERIWHAGMRLEETWAEAEKRKQADSSLPLARNPSYQLNADHYSLEKNEKNERCQPQASAPTSMTYLLCDYLHPLL